MKNIIKHGIILILLLSTCRAMAAGEVPAQVVLRDITAGFPVLKENIDIFYQRKYRVRYAGDVNKTDTKKNTILIESRVTAPHAKNRVNISLYSHDSMFRKYMMQWETPLPWMFNSALQSSLKKAALLAERTFNDRAENIILKKKHNGFDLSDIDALSKMSEKGSRPSRYIFTINERPSLLHRVTRTSLELLLLNGIGQAHYWLNEFENKKDWEYDFTLRDFKRKMTDPWYLDPNNFRVNSLYHAYAGCLYYQAAKSNGFGMLGSTISAFSGSLFWEYIGEYREPVSLNDMIFTTMGGVLLGEALSSTALFIEKNFRKSFLRDFTLFFLDPMRIINRQLDRAFCSSFRVRLVFLHPAQQLINTGTK